MAYIEIEKLWKSFGSTKVINGVSLEVNKGEFLVLVGPSGCGKSTLLRMIAGLESIDEGIIAIDGITINDLPPKNRDIAMVFQNYALYPHMTVYENLAFGLKVKGEKKKEYHSKIIETAELLSLSELLNRKPKQLSGGQKQRIAVGRAIVRNPKAFLFDEPLSNLDAKLRVRMRADLLRLHKQQKATSLYVTHDQVEAMTMADRVVIINKGIIQQIDTPMNVYHNPANRFVAEFMGSPPMNTIEGELKRKKEGYAFFVDGYLMFDGMALGEEIQDGPVVLGIRPEDISLTSTGRFKMELKMHFSIDLVEHMGDFSYAHIQLFGTKNWTIKTIMTDAKEGSSCAGLFIDEKKTHFFDPVTGEVVSA